MRITEAMLDAWGITDVDAIMELLGDPDWDDDGMFWTLEDATDADKNGIPDVLDGLVETPIITNPSQGGILG